MRTSYEGHDLAYQRKRAAGEVGWASEQDYVEHFAVLDRMLARPRVGAVLELGCGAGNVSLWLAREGFDVTGVDIAPTAIAWAHERAAGAARFVVGSVLDLAAFPDAAFDLIVDGHCLHCIIGADRARCLASAWRVLRPGGRLCVRTMCGDPCESLRGQFDPETRCLVRDDIATRYLGPPEAIADEVRAAGFEITRSEIEAAGADQPMLLLLAVKLS